MLSHPSRVRSLKLEVRASNCQAICGDAVKAAEEGCDDGNRFDGDGCDSSCVIEPDWWNDRDAPGTGSMHGSGNMARHDRKNNRGQMTGLQAVRHPELKLKIPA